MIELDTDILTSLEHGPWEHRTFIWLVAKDRTTGEPVTDGYWNDHGRITIEVLDPETGSVVEREFYGSGGLVNVSEIPRVLDITVQTLSVTLTQLASRVNDLLRTYDLRIAPVTIFRGIYNPRTNVLIAPAYSRFHGFVNKVTIKEPPAGEEGADAVLDCVSHTQEMTRSNTETRSSPAQKLRDPTDTFLDDVEVVGEWELTWGVKKSQVGSIKGGKK